VQQDELVPIQLVNGTTFYVDAETAERHRRIIAALDALDAGHAESHSDAMEALRRISDIADRRIDALEEAVGTHSAEIGQLERQR
jgi:hypothetical protein